MDAPGRARLKVALDEYKSIMQSARALTATQARRRAELLAKLCELTGAPPSQARRRAQRLLKAPKRMPKGGKKARYGGVEDLTPRAAVPRPPDAVRVTRVVPTAIETRRRTH
jgi:hypothetical protein